MDRMPKQIKILLKKAVRERGTIMVNPTMEEILKQKPDSVSFIYMSTPTVESLEPEIRAYIESLYPSYPFINERKS